MARLTKAEKATDARIQRAYGLNCSGIQIPIMATVAVWKVAHKAIADGADDAALGAAILAYVNTVKVS